jgi:protein transport protein SEC24
VPPEYFNHLDHSGRRLDCFQRPELCLGTYEIAATKQYCKVWFILSVCTCDALLVKDEKWPEPPAYIFMIDVSFNSVRSGLVHSLCHMLKQDLLDYLPKCVFDVLMFVLI